MITSKEKLIKDLGERGAGYWHISEIADYIIEDRKLICDPIVKELATNDTDLTHLKIAATETLNLAGLNTYKPFIKGDVNDVL